MVGPLTSGCECTTSFSYYYIQEVLKFFYNVAYTIYRHLWWTFYVVDISNLYSLIILKTGNQKYIAHAFYTEGTCMLD